MNTTKHYNCLGCPQCSSPLHDPLFVLEFRQAIKTVKCENCDFIGYRKGWSILNKQEENEYKHNIVAQRNKTKQPTMDDRKQLASTIC